MTQIFLGLGSNVRPAHFLPLGLRELRAELGALRLSPAYRGAAMGFDGEPFWNLVAGAQTALPVGELQAVLRNIEFRHGRPENAVRNSPRTLDIDILTYGDLTGTVEGVELPRGEILYHAFVLRPLAELAPDELHPVTGESYAAIWDAFDQASQPLETVELDLS